MRGERTLSPENLEVFLLSGDSFSLRATEFSRQMPRIDSISFHTGGPNVKTRPALANRTFSLLVHCALIETKIKIKIKGKIPTESLPRN